MKEEKEKYRFIVREFLNKDLTMPSSISVSVGDTRESKFDPKEQAKKFAKSNSDHIGIYVPFCPISFRLSDCNESIYLDFEFNYSNDEEIQDTFDKLDLIISILTGFKIALKAEANLYLSRKTAILEEAEKLKKRSEK